jgi:hypothetical protein
LGQGKFSTGKVETGYKFSIKSVGVSSRKIGIALVPIDQDNNKKRAFAVGAVFYVRFVRAKLCSVH